MQKRLSRYFIQIDDDFGTLSVSWLRQILSDTESLLTAYAKHKFYELHYVLDGELQIRTAQGQLCVRAGTFVLLPPDTYHEITAFAPQTRKLVFGFSVRFADTDRATALQNTQIGIREESLILRKTAELLALLPNDIPSVAGVQLHCLTEVFFFELLRLTLPSPELGAPPRLKADSEGALMDRLYAVIHSRLGGEFPTVDELAGLLHISRRHLYRITVDTIGKTPKELLDEERCAYIRELLATTEYSLHEIAFLSGFAGAYSLVRFFRTKEGCTPNQYRKDIIKT